MSISRSLLRVVTGLAIAGLALGMAPSAAYSAVITPPVTVLVSPDSLTYVTLGQQAVLEASAQDGAAADVPVEAWQFAASESGTYVDIASTAGLGTLTLPAVTNDADGWYRAAFPDGSGGRVYSAAGRIDVGAPPTVSAPTGATYVAVGQSFQLTTTVGGDQPVSLSWESAASASGPWSAVAGAAGNPQSFTASLTAGTTTYYRVVASSDWGEATSGAKAVTTYDGPAAPASVEAVNSAPGQLTVSWTAGSATGIAYGFAVEIVETGSGATTSRNVSASPTVFSGLAAGTYQVRVKTTTAAGDSGWTDGPVVTVEALVQTGTASGSTVRPYVDGYQDAVTLSASSNFPASGSIKVRNGSGTVVRSFTLSTGTSWSFPFNGRTASGVRLPNGAYTATFVLGGATIATKAITIASSQVGYPSASWSVSTVYPAKDGYRDSATLKESTTIPATVTVVIVNSSGRTVFSKSLTRRTTASIAWSGRSTSTGAILPAGTYRAKITVKGGEGTARSVTRSISVSAKKVTAVSFSGTISAVNAYDFTIVGDYEPMSDGSIGLWSSYYLGDTIHAFSFDLPTSFGNRYSNLKVYGCGESSSYTGTAGMLRADSDYATDYGGWLLGSDYACYGGTWSPSLLNGRRMYTIVGNAAADSTYYWLDGFKVTGTKYVLK